MKVSPHATSRFTAVVVVMLLFVLVVPGTLLAVPTAASQGSPPIAAQLVREGDLAAALDSAFGLGNGRNEIEAENRLADAGIAPKNGWMADYPVTPDILGELQESVIAAADSRKLSLTRDEAQQRFAGVLAEAGLTERPYEANAPAAAGQAAPQYYPDEAILSDYYAGQGPPIVTYYAPPPQYSYLYWWVNYPFWYSGAWLPGYFILRDFHRHHHHRGFVSNHYVHPGTHAVFRVNPTARLAGQGHIGVGPTPVPGVFPARGQSTIRPTSPSPGRFTPASPRPQMGPRNSFSGPPRTGARTFAGPTFSTPHAHSFAPPRMAMTTGGMRSTSFSRPSGSGGFHGSRSGGGHFSSGGSRGGGGHHR